MLFYHENVKLTKVAMDSYLGFHAQSGSSFHAKIDTDKCTYCGAQGMRQGGNKLRNNESYATLSASVSSRMLPKSQCFFNPEGIVYL